MCNLLTTQADPCVSLARTSQEELHVGLVSSIGIGKKYRTCIKSREKSNTLHWERFSND